MIIEIYKVTFIAPLSYIVSYPVKNRFMSRGVHKGYVRIFKTFYVRLIRISLHEVVVFAIHIDFLDAVFLDGFSCKFLPGYF